MTDNAYTPFNYPHFKIRQYNFEEVKPFVYGEDPVAQISEFNIRSILNGYQLLNNVYMLLQMSGYSLHETHFKIEETTKAAVINHDTLEVRIEDAENITILIKAEPIITQPATHPEFGCAMKVGIGITTETALLIALRTQFSVFNDHLLIYHPEDETNLRIEIRIPNVLSADERVPLLKRCVDVLYLFFFIRLNARIAAAYSAGEEDAPNRNPRNEENEAADSAGIVRTISETGLALLNELNHAAGNQEISINSANPSGLLWIFDPDNWELQLSDGDEKTYFAEKAEQIWTEIFNTGFRETERAASIADGLGSWIDDAIEASPYPNAVGKWFVKLIEDRLVDEIHTIGDIYDFMEGELNRTFLLMQSESSWLERLYTREERARFIFSIKESIEAEGLEVPEHILWNMEHLSYFELILTLVNLGIIKVPVRSFEPIVLENVRIPYYQIFHYVSQSEAEERGIDSAAIERQEDVAIRGVTFYIYDKPVTVLYRYPLIDLENMTGPDQYRFHTGNEVFSWEYKPPTENSLATLLIVAAPGVEITGAEDVPVTCQVIIYRVQDPALVPEWGDPVIPEIFAQPYTPAADFVVTRDGEIHDPRVFDYNAHAPDEYVIEERILCMPPDIAMRHTDPSYTTLQNIMGEDIESFYNVDGAGKLSPGEMPAFYIKPKYHSNGHLVGVTISNPVTPEKFGPEGAPYSLDVEITVDPYSAEQRFSYYIDRIDENWKQIKEIREKPLGVRTDKETYILDHYLTHIFEQYKLVVHHTPGVKIKVSEKNRGVFKYPITLTRKVLASPPEEKFPIYEDQDYIIYNKKEWVRSYFYEVSDFEDYHYINLILPTGHDLAHDVSHFYYKYDDSPGVESAQMDELSIMERHHLGRLENIHTAPVYEINVLNPYYKTSKRLGAVRFSSKAEYSTEGNSWATIGGRIGVDLIIGFIPYVGDAVDIADLALVLTTGKDKWGEPVSDIEILIMIGGTALPLISSSALKSIVGGAADAVKVID